MLFCIKEMLPVQACMRVQVWTWNFVSIKIESKYSNPVNKETDWNT